MTRQFNPDEVRELCEQATSGPWQVDEVDGRSVRDSTGEFVVASVAARKEWPTRANAAFIAAARDLVPALADEVAEMRALFELQWTRMGEATARWRAEDPEARALVMPDLGDLLKWLMGEADREHQRADGWADQYNQLARKCADLRDERDTARDAERERIADWFEREADVWRVQTGQTAVKCEYDWAAETIRDLDPDGAR